MPKTHGPAQLATRRVRVLGAWLLTALLVLGYMLIGEEPDDELHASHPLRAGAPQAGRRLDILEVEPNEPAPGRTIEVRFVGGDASTRAPELRAQLSQSAQGVKADFELLNRRDDLLVLRVPRDAKAGPGKLRLFQGDEKSKPYDLRIEPLNRRKMYRSIVGGLALSLFGLTTLSSGARAYTGTRARRLLARISGRTPLALALGIALGGITQFTTTVAGLVVGLIDSHLLAVAPAAAILLGAQIGAAATPSVLGLASTREGLLVAAVGVVWLTLAIDRRGRAIGKLILGCGLLFYGLHVLRIGFEPLVSDPELLPHIERFNAGSVTGLLACAGAGVLLAALLQSPAPVFAIVLGLAEATGRLDLQSALAILAGTGLGAALGTAVVASPFGAEPRRLARLHLALAALGSVLLLASVNLWAFVADALVSGSPEQVAYGKKVLLPNLGRHLVLAFVLSQATVGMVLAAILPSLRRSLERASVIGVLQRGFARGLGQTHVVAALQRGLDRVSERASVITALQRPRAGAAAELHEWDADALRGGMASVLRTQQSALDGVLALCLSGDRALATRSEHALLDARAELEALFVAAAQPRGRDAGRAILRKAVVATLALQRSAEELLRQAEAGVERGYALSEHSEEVALAERDAQTLRALHDLLQQGVSAAIEALRSGGLPDLDEARAREIRLNALELESRRALLADQSPSASPTAIALRLAATDLVNAYESVGNHLYRLCEALASEVDQDALPLATDPDSDRPEAPQPE